MENRPWVKNYPAGIPANIDFNVYNSMTDFVDQAFKRYADLDGYECMGKVLKFKEVDKLADQFGAYLQSRGLEKGDKIALMMPNLLQFPICLIGALRAGLIIVNTNPLYTPREMEYQFKDSDVKAIVIAENFAANLEKILDNTDIKIVITTGIGDLLGSLKGGFVNFAVKHIKRMVPTYDIPNSVSFKNAISQGKKFKLNPVKTNPEDVIVHQYTGGTTGVAKGAMLTNQNLLANMLQIKAWLGPTLKNGVEVILTPLPLYHIFAFSVNLMSMMDIGAKNILVTNPRDLKKLVAEFDTNEITVITGVNTLFNAMLNTAEFRSKDFSKLKVTVGGGMAVQNSVAARWKEVTGCTLSEGYGLTETSPVVSINPLDDNAKIGTIGLPIPGTDVRIVAEDGTVLGTDEVGELQVRGPQVMKGYYKKPEDTEATFSNGWLKTGDMALMQADGFLKIVDRKKDMILVSGFNVYPNEIEDVVASHPKVLEVAAVGIPDEHSGDVVKIFVVKKDKSLKEKELKTYCRENLTGYKRPREIEFRKELPKSPVGKILRKELREEKR